MFVRLIKTHRKTGYLLFSLVVLGILMAHIESEDSYVFINGEENYVLFGLIHHWLEGMFLLNAVLTAIFVLLNGFILFRIYRDHLFPNSWSMLPAVLFAVLTAAMPEFESLHPVWIAVLFLLFAIDRLFGSFDTRKPYGPLFETGFLLSLGSMFYFNLLILVPAFLIGSKILIRDSRWREPFLLCLGVLVPWILAFTAFFMLDKTGNLLHSVYVSFLVKKESILDYIPRLVYLGFLILLTIGGSYTILRQYAEKKVKFRKFYLFFFLLFVLSIISFLLVPAVSSEMFIVAAVPVTFLLSNYFDSFKRYLFAEIFFAVLLGFVVFFHLV